jgi:restriction endonuclease Mrr
MFEKREDYLLPLLSLLDSLPQRSGATKVVVGLFEERYRSDIPPEHYTKNNKGYWRWEWHIQWLRYEAVKSGLMDSPKTGIWRLTEKGHQWLREYPNIPNRDVSLFIKQSLSPAISRTDSYATKATEKNLEGGLMLETFGDFIVPLMRVLDKFSSHTGKCQDVLRLFEETYRDQITQHGFTQNESGHIRWEWNVQWSRMKLKQLGYLDAPRTGIWRLTEKGHQWLIEHPNATYLSNEKPRTRRRARASSLIPHNNGESHFLAVDKTMPTEAFPMHRILDQEVETIRDYLQGRSSLQLSDEKLCDLVNFCYTFGMYVEGKELFSLISGAEVNPWYYERTKKIAKACEYKVQ